VTTYWPTLSYFFLFPLFLLVSIAVTFINTVSACYIVHHVGRINLGTFGAALTCRCSGLPGASMPLSSSIWDSMLASRLSSLAFRISASPFKLSQFTKSEMLSDELCPPLPGGCWSILLIRRTFNTSVRPPGRSFADNACGNGDLSDNVNAAIPPCWKFDQVALMIFSVSEIYPMAVICFVWAKDSFGVAGRYWLPCHISKKMWTLAILCNFLSSTLSSIPSHFQSAWYAMLGNHPPLFHY